MKLLIPSLLSLFLIAYGGDSSTSASNSDDGGNSSEFGGRVVIPGTSSSVVVIPGSTGNLTDTRDGQTYKTVTIGTQTWMAQNLNYETANSYCYGDNASNCTKYGRLYTWAAAMDSAGTWSTNGKGCGYGKACSVASTGSATLVRGVCPEGWHLPSKAEWETLFNAVGGQSTAGKVLKSTSGWNSSGNGSDVFLFSALPAGNRDDDGSYYNQGIYALFWSSTEFDSNLAYYMFLYYNRDYALLDGHSKNYGFSVRCLKD